MSRTAPGRRMAAAALAAVASLGAAASWQPAEPHDRRPNVIVVLTDDQRWDELGPMPWLRGQLERPASGWALFPDAFASTPLCCPARTALLSGRYARHTGVLRNRDAHRFDESSTLATWLHDAGYRTGLVGKYLNGFPFGRPTYVPPGWDRFVAKLNRSASTVYRDFDVVDQGSQVRIRGSYATDWLAERAIDFLRTAPRARPFFLLFAPSAPHAPWVPADRDAGALGDETVVESPSVAGALRGAPAWVRSLPDPSTAQRAVWMDERRRADETLLAVDDAIAAIVAALGDRIDETLVFVLSDHGYSFGEHRWEGKKCPYDECVRIPLVVHSLRPGSSTRDAVASTVDLAPTILSLAGVPSPGGFDGERVAELIEPPFSIPVDPRNGAVYLEWAGDSDVPAWTAVRTAALKLIRYGDGFEELYDIGGRLSAPDPSETTNRIGDLRYATLAAHLRALLRRNLGPG